MTTKTRRDVAQRYEIEIVANEHGAYYARVPAFTTIFTGGATPAEALANGRRPSS